MKSDFLIVFEPKDRKPNRRFLVSPNTLPNYITKSNANKVICEAKNLKENKRTLKFRKYGKIDIYLK